MVTSRQAAASPAESPRTGAELSHLEGIDGIRAIAAIAVFFTHWAALTPLGGDATLGVWWSQLNIGVSIFFVLSGFLLYRPFVLAATGGGRRPELKGFLIRRAFRIYPAYWVAFAFDMWLGWQLRLSTNIGWLTNITLTDDYFRNAEPTSGLPQSWTLVVEVGFYLFLPLFVLASGWLLSGRGKGRLLAVETIDKKIRIHLAVLMVIGLVSMTLTQFDLLPEWASAIDIGDFELHPFNFLRWLAMFAAGMTLAHAWVRHHRGDGDDFGWFVVAGANPVRCWLAAFGLFFVLNEAVGIEVGSGATISDTQWAIRHVLHIAIAVLLILPAIAPGPPGPVRRFLRHRTMVVAGTASYGIYLWHFGLLVFLRREWLKGAETGDVVQVATLLVVGLALSVLLGWLSYHLIEAPARSLARRLSGSRSPGGS